MDYVHNPMYGRYKPFKDIIHHEVWRVNGNIDFDYTYESGWPWYHYEHARRDYRNIPNDENIYSLRYTYYSDSALWTLYNEIILDLYGL